MSVGSRSGAHSGECGAGTGMPVLRASDSFTTLLIFFEPVKYHSEAGGLGSLPLRVYLRVSRFNLRKALDRSPELLNQ